ncbi:hypothetical protein AB7M37_003598 [Sinorhizobium fredii]
MTGTQSSARKRIGEPAGDEEECRQLREIETEQGEGGRRSQAMRRREANGEKDIEQCQAGNQQRAGDERQGELQPQRGDDDGHGLAADRQPAQPHQCLQPQAAIAVEFVVVECHRRHAAYLFPYAPASKVYCMFP